MIRVGIVGFGFMGKHHTKLYKSVDNVEVVAICDTDEEMLKGHNRAAGNIDNGKNDLGLDGIELYTDYKKMFKKANLDAVSITLPTYMHKECTIKALKAGLHVLCEKPMAMNPKECDAMIAAAEKAGKILQIGHCMRFWPEYVEAKEILESGKYGKLKAATFQRLSLTPIWSWDNWLLDSPRSGGAAHDLHIHDSDFVQFLLGMPKAVRSFGVKGPSHDFDHIVTSFIYDDDKVIIAEGGFMMTPSFGFEMSFNLVLEKATISYDCTRDPAFKICPLEGEVITAKASDKSGHLLELVHFAKAIAGETVPQVITPEQSKESVKLLLAEKKSAESGKEVKIK